MGHHAPHEGKADSANSRSTQARLHREPIWEVPQPVPPSEHRINYRLAYVAGGVRVVGYDNERGKGDHRHVRGRERPYAFVDVPTLIRDFLSDVKEAES